MTEHKTRRWAAARLTDMGFDPDLYLISESRLAELDRERDLLMERQRRNA